MTASFTASEYEALPEGLYRAQVVSIEEMPGDQFGPYLRWTFNLRRPDGSVTTAGFNTSDSTGPKSNAYKWAAGILGRKPTAGETQDLAGKTCQLAIVVNEDGFNRIEAVLPATTGTTSQAPAPVFEDSPPAKLAPVADVPF